MAKFSPVKTIIGKMTSIDSSLIGRMDSISSSESLIGKMNPTESISGKVEKPSDMSGEININPEKDIPTYDGNYIVIPKTYKEQILETKEKMMEDNVVVKKIPYYETSNVDGGETVYIAGESVTAQSKTATPSTTSQTILPDTTYDYLSQVVVEAIPYTESPNSAGGTTVTIG